MDITRNKKAYHDYEILDKYEAGVVLTGNEIKSIRLGHVNLKDSFIKITSKNEITLNNAHISVYEKAHKILETDPIRSRKLLMHKKEIIKLSQQINEKGLTIIPLKMYYKKNNVKVSIALARGKKLHDKRQALKERDIKREIDKQLKHY